MKMVDNLEDQLLEEKARMMSMLEYISRTDLESDHRPQLGLAGLNKTETLGPTSPDHDDDAGEKLRRPSQTYASLIREVPRTYTIGWALLQLLF